MQRLSLMILAAALLLGAPAMPRADEAGTARHGTIEIDGAWIRSTLPGRPAAGYLAVMNRGETSDRLISARIDGVDTVELHESMMADGVMKMQPVEAVEIAPGGMAELKPGGMHMMLFGTDGLTVGEPVEVVLIFEQAGEVTVTVPVLRRAPDGHRGQSGHGGDSGHRIQSGQGASD